ncbi:uncharacterized protein [Drosophila tropicalis]|uniref:uncharacterized protein isoform X2 n=1 Tax=Drosophila tropicalis TaxID=46794 RepID=UPI0035ABF0F3
MDQKDIGDGSLPLDQTESISFGSPQTPPHKLTTSSAALNSWTILPDERIELLLDSSNDESGSVARREEEQRLNQEQQDEKHANDRSMRPLDDVQTVGAGAADDISDGISIISDCESTERISPHPFLRDHLNELLHFNDLSTPIVLTTSSSSQAPDQQPEENQLKERRRESAPKDDDDNDVTLSNNDKNLMVRQQTSSALSAYQRLPNLVQSGLTAVFYVGVTLAILAFIGKLRHPEWENGTGESGKSMGNLERRLDDLELQNNLMRAEIDLISKQLQYLSSDQGPTQQQQQGRKAKTFKAWSGNGDAGQPVDITKEDLKRPFKCQDGNYVEFAAMCLESKKTTAEHAESLVDEIGNVVNDVLQQSQTFQRFEKVTDRLAASTNGDGDGDANYVNGNGDKVGSEYSKKQQQRQKNINKYSSESTQTGQTGSHHQHQHSREEQQSKFYKKQRYAANSKENDSKERYKKKFYKEHDDSDEHRSQQRGKKPRQMSKEDDDEDDDNNNNSGSGEWHERMMQHREQSRKRNHHNNKSNWYIERGDSREQKRSSETKR